MGVNVAMLQQRIELEARHLQQPACFVVCQDTRPVALDGKCFECLPAGIRSLRNVAGQFDRNPHESRVTEWARAVAHGSASTSVTAASSAEPVNGFARI
jgi:hypothetical protein